MMERVNNNADINQRKHSTKKNTSFDEKEFIIPTFDEKALNVYHSMKYI